MREFGESLLSEDFLKWNRPMFERFASRPGVREALKGFDKTLQFEFSDINTSFFVTGERLEFHVGKAGEPDCTMKMSSETWEKIMSGNMSFEMAFVGEMIVGTPLAPMDFAYKVHGLLGLLGIAREK